MRKKPVKEFYNFLCQEGVLFQFLDLLKETRYKRLSEHCKVNRPVKYVTKCYIFGRITSGDWDIKWKPINERWIQHLSINLYKMRK
jgi:hypothetical protein